MPSAKDIPSNQQLTDLALTAGQRLAAAGVSLATAESCTGGWVAKLVTDVAGSSAWFDRGFVTYSNQAKQDMLGVPETLLERYGAVSGEVVAAMTAGALQASRAHWALAISGIAGPDGGSLDKPVGTVWLAWQARGMKPDCLRYHFDGGRDAVRRAACAVALQRLIDKLGDA